LGPSDLYKLTKEIGKFVQNFRTFTTEATASLENNLESQLQLEEIRKAQRELNDAFSFRRSINVDSDTDPFEVNVKSPRLDDAFAEQDREFAAAAAASSSTAVADGPSVPAKKKRVRRVKKQKVAAPVPVEDDDDDNFDFDGLDALSNNLQQAPLANNVPDLDAFDEDDEDGNDSLSEAEKRAMESMKEARDQLKKERMERLQQRGSSSSDEGGLHKDDIEAPANELEQQSRFQQQLSGDWNNKILEMGDKLDPMENIMNRLALLEDQKIAADKRLQEEFKSREENEERYYREKKKLLEEAAAQVQAWAYESITTGVATTREGATKN
jgi:Sec-independent protein translocase protein TatA